MKITAEKFTDKEIIKALECCDDFEWCGHCSLQGVTDCRTVLTENALDLINRQQAEIEQWKAEANKYQNWWCQEIDIVQTSNSEAIKEFAERLKENTIDVDVSYGYGREHYTEAVAVIEIDNLVKEMIGE